MPARPALAQRPFYFPPTPQGWPGQVRDERDVAPYLAFQKAAAMRRAAAAAQPMTANQALYDVHYYNLDLNMNVAAQVITGTVGMKASVVTGPLTTVDLDFASNMVVDQVSAGGVAGTFTRSGNVLTINLDRAYATGETIVTSVQYHGTPTGGYFGFSTAYGRPLVWSLSEAFGARTWWPCKDTNEDKADSVDIRVTCPTGLKTASNGTRVFSSDNGVVAVTRWRERYPIVTYLVSVACYAYSTYSDWFHYGASDSMEIQFYIFPEDLAAYTPDNAKVKNMIAAFTADFGAYPFLAEKYGHAEFLFGGGMEHQTCTYLGVSNEYVDAHELAHQWWGDMITCRDFHHIWLNEGFATYCEALWAESLGGITAYHNEINFNKYFGAGTVYVPDLSNEFRIFDSNLSYNKPSWILHMLRHIMGDAAFFQALRNYYARYQYSTAVTEDFRDVCAATGGRNLDKFFQEWVYGEYYPAYRYDWTTTPAGGGYDVTVTLDQTQTNQIFWMPIDVTITTGSGSQTFVAHDSLATQNFVFHVAGSPTMVTLDKDDWVLKTVQELVSNPSFDRSLLVVNGVSWPDYGAEITTAYADRAFTGGYNFDFWDCFAAPAGGYPANVPAPLGHGTSPADLLGHYRNVIWVGNNFNGDLAMWLNAPIQSYLDVGGNVLLMTRMGDLFLTPGLQTYLGVNWYSTGALLNDCVAVHPGLSSLAIISGTAQNACAVFDTTLAQPESVLLYKAVSGFSPNRGLGVCRRPAAGGTYRLAGGRFIFLSGRPYRWTHSLLAANVEWMLENLFQEPRSQTGVPPVELPVTRLGLAPPRPNPFNASTVVRFSLPSAGAVILDIIDVRGRLVRRLDPGILPSGPNEAVWDGLDGHGVRAAPGVYWARISWGGRTASVKMVKSG